MLSGGGSTNWKTFADVKAQNLGHEKAEYFTVRGTVVFMKKENCMYTVSDNYDDYDDDDDVYVACFEFVCWCLDTDVTLTDSAF